MKGKFIDLTSLTGLETKQDIIALCNKAIQNQQYVAGVCSWSKWSELIKEQLQQTDIKTIAVLNFPYGKHEDVCDELYNLPSTFLPDEIDVVVDWKKVKRNNFHNLSEIVSQVCEMFPHTLIKAILESGELTDFEARFLTRKIIKSRLVGFIKTSTGKTKIGATPEKVKIICEEIKYHNLMHNSHCGIKISGGIKTDCQAQEYINIVKDILGDDWLNTNHFRIGIGTSSNLLQEWCN